MKKTTNKVFIATSLDGYIADQNGSIAWLDTIPEINTIDTGYNSFTESIDALLMGKSTFETLCGFDIEWPYTKPVFVLSNTLKQGDLKFGDKVKVVSGTIAKVLALIHAKGHHHLYIDGGQVIQSFLKEDLIDEMIITVIPILLGGGTALFSSLDKPMEFECTKTIHFLEAIVQNHYKRSRKK